MHDCERRSVAPLRCRTGVTQLPRASRRVSALRACSGRVTPSGASPLPALACRDAAMAEAAASPSGAMDDASALRFFDERVRWQASQFEDAMRDVEVSACCAPARGARPLAQAHPHVHAAVRAERS